MRKQITVPNKLDELVKAFAKACDVSESCIYSYALNLLSVRFNCAESINEEQTIFLKIKDFYRNFYISNLPRGKNAKERINNMCK